MDIRQNIYSLTDDQLLRFQNAVNELKADGTYDYFTELHHHSMHEATVLPGEVGDHLLRNTAHRGPAFLPWHRYYCREFERALQEKDPTVTLPYWDWAADSLAGAEADLWNTDPERGRIYIGGDGEGPNSTVNTGPFAGWEVLVEWGTGFTRRPGGLRRFLGRDIPTLPTPEDVEDCITNYPVYDTPPWHPRSESSFRNRLEGWPQGPALHNRVHVWVGGDMGPGTSPNDPVFFLHHCFIDKVWAEWQATHGAPYQPVSEGPLGHNLHDEMSHLDSTAPTPANCLDYRHDMGYIYDTDPPTVTLRGDTLHFHDIAAGDVGRLFISLEIRSAQPLTFEFLSTETLQAPYSMPAESPIAFYEPQVDSRAFDSPFLFPIFFTGEDTPGPAPSSSVDVLCHETGETFTFTLSGNSTPFHPVPHERNAPEQNMP